MEEERLIHLLRGLPREKALGGFTAQVLRRLDEEPQALPRRRPSRQGWHRLMVATATVAAFGVSVGVSVGLLQREHSPGPLAAAAAAAARAGKLAAAAAGSGFARALVSAPAAPAGIGTRAAARAETMIGMSTAGGPQAPPQGARQAASRPGGRLDSAQAHQLLRELQLESVRLERELRSLRRTGRAYGAPPAVLYLGGDENVDLVLNTGRMRAQGQPLTERDGGNDNNFLD
jgi:hypothetical protein